VDECKPLEDGGEDGKERKKGDAAAAAAAAKNAKVGCCQLKPMLMTPRLNLKCNECFQALLSISTCGGTGHRLTLDHTSAQLELSLCPTLPNLTHEYAPNVLKLSSDANECKPLVLGASGEQAGSAAPGQHVRQERCRRHRRRAQAPAHRGRVLHSFERNLSNSRTHSRVHWVIRWTEKLKLS
jgi:hypothetical protein